MAKIKHTNTYDVIDHVATTAKKKKVMHLSSQEDEFNGEFLKINNKELINFGTCGYLGLEKHPHILAKSRDLLDRYGSHFSISRTYVKASYQDELENLISKIFDNHPVITFTSTSVAHQSVVGTIIQPSDLIILDQQVHYSVQYPCQFAKLQGTMVKMIRHNNMEMLEEFIKRGYNQYDKIWFMADGVYSMYGDLPHKKELLYLLEKYPKLHLYFDDAHGVGWTGTNGCGSVFEHFKHSKRVILMSTLAKGFGCIGGVAVFNDAEMHRRVNIYGGILAYTHPLSPANVGAAIGSAELLLSDKIHVYQKELKDSMEYLNVKLEELNLTNTSSNETPIYFIGTGSVKVAQNLVQRVLADGLYVNTATFPVVPNDKTGLRFTLTRHNTKEHIDQLVGSIGRNFHIAVDEEKEDLEKIYKTFNVPFKGRSNVKTVESKNIFVEIYNSIDEIDVAIWDNLFKDNGSYSHNGLRCIEEIFSNNDKIEENWGFHYVIIKDEKNEILLATFFTSALYKDDMLSLENISRQIEKQREQDPYYLCSKTLAMGSLFTEGKHLFVDEKHPLVNEALSGFFIEVEKLKKATDSTVVLLRDFQSDFQYVEHFENEGFVKINMPNVNVIPIQSWKTNEEFLGQIPSKNNKRNIERYVLKFEDQFDITFKNTITSQEAEQYYNLFQNVKKDNHAVNYFKYPAKITQILSKYDDWEFMDIKLKGGDETICCVWSFRGDKHYSPLIMGLNYEYVESMNLYKQAIFQLVKRANYLNKEKVFLGYSADYEKQKYGANTISLHAFIKLDDTFNMELIESMSNMKTDKV